MSTISKALDFDFGAALKSWELFRPGNLAIAAAAIGLAVFTYLIFVTEPLLHNHDLRMPWLTPGGIGSGRWMSGLIGRLQYSADLPVFVPVTGIVLLVVSAMLISEHWDLGLSRISRFIVVAAFVTYPGFLAFFFYTFSTSISTGSVFMVAAALYVSSRLSLLRMLAATAVIVMMLATYQPSLSIFVTGAIVAAIAQIIHTPSASSVGGALLLGVARAGALAAGGVIYRISLALLGVTPPRAIDYMSWDQVPGRVVEVVGKSIEHLYTTQPEFLKPIKLLLLGFLVAAMAVSLFKARRSVVSLVAIVLLWPLAVIGTKAIFLVIEPDGSIWEYRYNISLGLLYVFSLAVVLSTFSRKVLTLGVQAVAAFVVVSFIQADHLRQGVILRGQQHDLALAGRILDRIETLPDIDQSRTYDLIRVGRYSFYRLGLFRSEGHGEAFDRLGDTHMDVGEVSDRWVDEEVFRLLGSGIRFRFQTTDPNFTAKIHRVQDELLEGRRPWPAPESVFINGDEIIVYMRNE